MICDSPALPQRLSRTQNYIYLFLLHFCRATCGSQQKNNRIDFFFFRRRRKKGCTPWSGFLAHLIVHNSVTFHRLSESEEQPYWQVFIIYIVVSLHNRTHHSRCIAVCPAGFEKQKERPNTQTAVARPGEWKWRTVDTNKTDAFHKSD